MTRVRFKGGPLDGLVGVVSGGRPVFILDKPIPALFDQDDLPEVVWQPKLRWYEVAR